MDRLAGRTVRPAAFGKVVEQLCELVGFEHPDLIIRGERLQVADRLISFINDAAYYPDLVFVYVDMGPIADENKLPAYDTMLKLNFALLAGIRGVMCIHPETAHLFYSLRYKLNASSTGKHLLDFLTSAIEEITAEMLNLALKVADADANADTHADGDADAGSTTSHVDKPDAGRIQQKKSRKKIGIQ